VLVLAFESADHPMDAWMKRALECCADFGGQVPKGAAATTAASAGMREGEAGAWRQAFLNAPYLMDTVAAMGMVSDTFETAITWDRFENFHNSLMETARRMVTTICGAGTVTVRFTHAYPDGPTPYYTVLAPGRRGSELEQWYEIKAAVSDELIRLGGTITHHHAVWRYHRPWYDRERPELLEPGRPYEFTITLYPTSLVFRRGHRIRLHVSSSNFPRFDVNPNTGGPLGRDQARQSATQTVFHDAGRPSRVVLPMIPT